MAWCVVRPGRLVIGTSRLCWDFEIQINDTQP
jgi:hypothetical protein